MLTLWIWKYPIVKIINDDNFIICIGCKHFNNKPKYEDVNNNCSESEYKQLSVIWELLQAIKPIKE